MKQSTIHIACMLTGLAVVAAPVGLWTNAAAQRARAGGKGLESQAVAVASAADEGYCSLELKQVLRRVLTSCGLLKKDKGRGCQPVEAKSVAAMSGGDFNALFKPLDQRAAILQFDQDKAELDDAARALLDKTFADQRGASYFLVVSRASPEGVTTYNRGLSEKRANAVLDHLKSRFSDPDLDQEVGLLWLGEEFAQLSAEFCRWDLSRPQAKCTPADLNRSAFVAWIDCRL